MSIMIRSIVPGLCLAMVCLVVGALPAAADTYPFTATYAGPFTAVPVGTPPTGLNVSGILTDPNASFGLTSMDFSVFLNMANTPNTLDNGTFTLSGASPDKLFATYTGTATGPGADNIVNLTANYVITGGEGMFAGATGGGVWTGQANVATGHDVHTFQGTVTTAPVPEPGTLTLLAAGAGLILRRRRRT